MWVNLKDNNQVTIIGGRSKAYGIGKRKSRNNKSNLSQMILSKAIYYFRIIRKKNIEFNSKSKEKIT